MLLPRLLPTDSTRSIFFLLLLLNANFKLINSSKCNRTPEGHGALQTPADGRFHIRILENTDRYTPGKTYTIKLEGIDSGQRSRPPSKHQFSGFMLVVEKNSNESGLADHSTSTFGVFTLSHGDTYTKITCANMVTHTTTTPKSEIQVLWTAPQPGSGCVAFKATVIEHRDVWYMDDGPLTKEFCEEEHNFDDEISTPLICCACTEAKYELTFEGLWSRNTHPKDFPSNNWVTKFSDIIGASHTIDYRFWKYGQVATDGLMIVAEQGSTRELETELKSQSGEIRTIIKAKGLTYPNITGKTFAVFRVDPTHSQVSFVSMIDPSPDWFLGVSGLELCLENCSSAESRTLDLYPWDAGTDSGANYTASNQPTNPREHIRRIRPDYPNDPRSPFYDPSGANMKPLARLYISRQRLYEKNCPEEMDNSDSSSGSRKACALGPWQESSPCDAQCGNGNKHQQRQYLNENLARQAGCKDELTQRIPCYGRGQNCNDRSDEVEETTEPSCALSSYSEWSECSARCGNGTQTRTRKYLQRNGKKYCEGGTNHPVLRQTKNCYTPCSGETTNIQNGRDDGQEGHEGQEAEEQEENQENQENEAEENGEECQTSEWSAWGPCSVSCGGGVRIKTRTPTAGKCEDNDLQEEKRCNNFNCEVPQYCKQEPVRGSCRNVTNMWFFNWEEKRCDVFGWSCGKHRNKFSTHQDCWKTCSEQNEMETRDETGIEIMKMKINVRLVIESYKHLDKPCISNNKRVSHS